ncbi:WD40/YVTN/BNR-like repeat-containing protein [Neptunomonas phycophila]|uniref:WD40/YVTN/BNR-like repeat-containing protein n=1 Tax=Neptunomonas phycophila TaxID=1572645 RepID=UPI00094897FC|nr:YCF48-related protein [Neptunomonas phycophila]
MNIVNKLVHKYLVPNRHRLLIIALGISLLGQNEASIAAVKDAIERPSEISTLGQRSVLLASAHVGKSLVAVGERGFILLSDDQAKSWRQVPSPISVTLTGVAFADEHTGYAIGHGGSVLGTTDGGESWKVLLNGNTLVESLLTDALLKDDQEAAETARFLMDDGPDKPFLDVLLISPEHLVVVGAYGFAFESLDGGQTWNSWMSRIDNPFGLHLYSVRKQGNRILIAGEQGFVALSNNNGDSFETIETPYEGSFFTAQLPDANQIVLAGLRGNTLVSEDNGANWKQLINPIPATITASLIDSDGQLVFANQAGLLLRLKNSTLVPVNQKPLPPLTFILEKSDGDVLALSINGAISLDSGSAK